MEEKDIFYDEIDIGKCPFPFLLLYRKEYNHEISGDTKRNNNGIEKEETTMLTREVKIQSKKYSGIQLKVITGHFATPSSHINYYIDMTTMKTRQNEAVAVAKALAQKYTMTTIVDTIVCMDGCEVIGAYLADELTKAGVMSLNMHETIYVVSPEFDSGGQIIFRDNLQPMINGKNIIVLAASITTGKTVEKSLECIEYYGGKIQGISVIFSAVDQVHGMDVNMLFDKEELPDYATFKMVNCPHCKNGQKIDAIVNGFGYSRI